MPTIAEDKTFTQVVQFETAPERQQALIAAIVSEVDRWVRFRRGFVSSTFHASHDGKRVLNYAQWRTEQDFQAFASDPEGQRLGLAIKHIGVVSGPDATHYSVIRSVEAPAQDDALSPGQDARQ